MSKLTKRSKEETSSSTTDKSHKNQSQSSAHTKFDTNNNVITTRYEWGGPIGAFFLLPILPLVTYSLLFLCNKNTCLEWSAFLDSQKLVSQLEASLPSNQPELPYTSSSSSSSSSSFSWLSSYTFFNGLFSLEAFVVYLAWFVFQIVLYFVLPGQVGEGLPLKDGTRLKYPFNGLSAFFVSIATVGLLAGTGYFPLDYIYNNFLQLLSATFVFSVLLSIYLYVSAVIRGTGYAEGGNSKNIFYDFWIGRELNPRIGSWDIKYFCELRPGLILWVIFDIAFMYKQYLELGYVTLALALVSLFHAYYVFDALVCEQAILSTMDITSDGFGYMLAFGDLVWVPFTFTSQTRYLVDYPQHLSWEFLAIILSIKALGYYLFRGANSQKDTFRRNPEDPSVKHLKFITTSTGRKLLTSGFWGWSRHINYLGDWLMALSWCLPAGFQHVVPYFYLFYFVPLLTHRERRDDEHCHHKYGADWERYRKIVKYRIIPYVY